MGILTKEMKLTTKLIAITLMLATATLAAGECTKDKCGKCEANTGATAKYCTQCVGAAIFGTAEDGSSYTLGAVLSSGASVGFALSALVLGALTSGKGGSGEHESDSNKFSSQLHFFR